MPSKWTHLELPEHVSCELDDGDVFASLIKRGDDVVREAWGRRTFRFALNGRSYFAKIHTGVGWMEILKNLTRLRRPTLGAHDEWKAIHRVQELGIRTTPPVAFGSRGRNPARRQSFLITEDLGDTVTLERFCNDNNLQKMPWPVRRWLINEVARMARTLHEHGINHRDMYLCHFRTHLNEQGVPNGELHLMDLHRAQIRQRVPVRLQVKDIGGLYFSAMNCGLTQQDFLRFVAAYSKQPWRKQVRHNRLFWRRVQSRARRMYQREHGHPAPEFGRKASHA